MKCLNCKNEIEKKGKIFFAFIPALIFFGFWGGSQFCKNCTSTFNGIGYLFSIILIVVGLFFSFSIYSQIIMEKSSTLNSALSVLKTIIKYMTGIEWDLFIK